MSTDAELPSQFVIPRPGVVKALGILNIVFSVIMLIGVIFSLFWFYAMVTSAQAFVEPGAGAAVNPMYGMNDPKVLRFTLIDAVTGLAVNAAMLASGIGLINLQRWGARLWTWTAWIKIVRLVVLWGFMYIIVVTPSLSENMGRSAVAMLNSQVGARRAPPLGELTKVYAVMNLIVGVGMVVFGSVYPAISLWILGRPGVKAALRKEAPKEPELT
jgi:hypothetical protein